MTIAPRSHLGLALCLIAASLPGSCSPRPLTDASSRNGNALEACKKDRPPIVAARARQVLQSGHGRFDNFAWSKSGLLATGSQFDQTIRFWDIAQSALLGVARVYETRSQYAWDETTKQLGLLSENLLAPDPAEKDHRILLDISGKILSDTSVQSLPVLRTKDGDLWSKAKLDTQAHSLTITRPGGREVTLPLPSDGMIGDTSETTLSRDGSRLLIQGVLGAYLWILDPAPQPPQKLAVPSSPSTVTYSPDLDSAFFAREGSDGFSRDLVMLPLPSGTPSVLAPLGNSRDSFTASVSGDGKLLAVASEARLQVWDLTARTSLWSVTSRHGDTKGAVMAGFYHASFSPDGSRLVVGVDGAAMSVYDARSGRLFKRLGEPVRQPTSVQWFDDHTLVAHSYGHVALWDTRRGVVKAGIDSEHLASVVRMAGGDLVSARIAHCDSGPTKVNVWLDGWRHDEPPDSLLAQTFPPPDAGCEKAPEAAPSPSWRWPPAPGSAPGPIVVHDFIAPFELDAESGLVLVASKPGILSKKDQVLDLKTGNVTPFEALTPRVLYSDHVLFRSGILAVGGPRSTEVWDARSGKKLATLSLKSSDESYASFSGTPVGLSADGTRIAVSAQSRVGIYELPSGKELGRFTFRESVSRVLFAGNTAFLGTEVVTTPRGGRVYRVEGDRPVLVAEDPSGPPQQLALDPSGERLAVVGVDGAVRLYNIATKRLLATLVEFFDDEFIAYSPGGSYRGTNEVAERVDWIFDSPVEPFRFDQFAQVYQKPELIERRLAGEDVEVDAALSRPPHLDIVSAPSTATGSARVTLRATSASRVDEVRAFVEGREAGHTAICAASGEVSLDVPLMPGVNRATFVAYDDRGFAGNPASVDITNTAPPSRKPDLWIVSVGVSRYQNLEPRAQLADADADARGIAAGFARAAGATFSAVHTKLLVNEQVTVPAAEEAMSTLAMMQPDDLAFVFFAGHGVRPVPDGDMVFLTANAAADPVSMLANGVGWRSISDAVAKAKGRVVVLLDACHSGAVSQQVVVQNGALASALADSGRTGAFVFAAAKGRQFSFEPGSARALQVVKSALARVETGAEDGGALGFFTGALLASLGSKETDSNGDGQIQMSELVRAVTERVGSATNGAQTPWVARQEILGDFGLFAAAR